ncbi:tyrosine-type recombinase/integrase [Shewanella halifaxensis]|uniref:tyrosine-type recombinase/integrase n=1 Tax=Shewanella halifaxensis TaxID=271098 RepID=UPI000D59FAAF|nr:tyrosine-type recombinase/integrase [Shewanella halifaxensis]
MRNHLNQHGVLNLYIKRDRRAKNGIACQYRDPRYGKAAFGEIKQYRSLGSNINSAMQQAMALNAIILPQIVSKRVSAIINAPTLSVQHLKLSKWIKSYIKLHEEKLSLGQIKPNTWRAKKHVLGTIDKYHGKLLISSITTKHIKQLLDIYTKQGKNRTAQSIRSVYIDLFTEAAQAGEIASDFNPAKVTKNPTSKVEKSRLSIVQFEAICHQQTYAPYLFSYQLALLTAQRRTDLCLLRKNKGDDWLHRFEQYKKNPNHFITNSNGYASFADLVEHAPYSFIEDDFLHIFQLKTGKLLKIPLMLSIPDLNLSLGEIIKKAAICKDSEFVLHHTVSRTANKTGDPIHPDTLSRSFKSARIKAEINWPGTPASFHEIRSLSERIHRDQGIDTKVLCGHSDQRMTDRYNDQRGFGWEEVKLI